MPGQKLCTSEPRTVELDEVFDELARVNRSAEQLGCHNSFTGLRSSSSSLSSLRFECCEFNQFSTPLQFAKECNHVKQSLANVDATVVSSSDSAAKVHKSRSPKIRSPKIGAPSLWKLPAFKTVSSGPAAPLVQAARAVVRSVETTPEKAVKLARKKHDQSKHGLQLLSSSEDLVSLSEVKLETSETAAPASISIPPQVQYRGVRERPGVKGFLAEIRPKRWKKTIWLGTHPTAVEAARAYDAGIFYTGKNIPLNFEGSKDFFNSQLLPEHLSLDDSAPEVMLEIKCFVQDKALEAARRGKAVVLQRAATQAAAAAASSDLPELLQTGNNRKPNTVSSCTSGGVQGSCRTSSPAAGSESSYKKACSQHVDMKNEECIAGQWDLVNSSPFENLEPLPGNLLHYSSKRELLGDDDDHRDCWGQWISLGVHDYLTETVVLEDAADLNITQQQTSMYLTEDDMHVPDHNSFQYSGFLGSKVVNGSSAGNPAAAATSLDSWGLPSFDLGHVRDDPFLGSDGLRRNFLSNVEACDSYASRQLHGLRFAMTLAEDASLMSGWAGSVQEPDDDHEFSVSLWQFAG